MSRNSSIKAALPSLARALTFVTAAQEYVAI